LIAARLAFAPLPSRGEPGAGPEDHRRAGLPPIEPRLPSMKDCLARLPEDLTRSVTSALGERPAPLEEVPAAAPGFP
jgi:hypothetical protein